MNYPRLTLGLPVYNGENFLRQAMAALLAQSFTDFELIIVDNCSTDSTPDICRHYASLDQRVLYHRNTENIGAAANFNKTVELARGQYFAWANHDDLWAKTYFEQCIGRLESHPAAVLAYSRSTLINDKGDEIRPLLDRLGFDAPRPHQRLHRFHQLYRLVRINKPRKIPGVEGLWIPVYGVMRTATLRKTGLIGPYIGSDTVLLEELLMHGEFVELKDRLFLKREHQQRSVRDCRSFDKRIAWFTGKSASRFAFPCLRRLRERILATRRTKLSRCEKIASYIEMLSCTLRAQELATLFKEAWINLRHVSAFRAWSKNLPRQW